MTACNGDVKIKNPFIKMHLVKLENLRVQWNCQIAPRSLAWNMEDRGLQLPSVEPLLLLPIPTIVHSVSNRDEARLLLSIGELAREFDLLMSYLPQWLEHQEYLKDNGQRAEEMTACQMLLAPLTSQAHSVNLHGVKLLQARITVCLQKLKKHMETVQVFANQNAYFATELRVCGLEDRSDQRRRLAETEAMLVDRLFKFLGGCDSFFDEPPLASVVGTIVEAVAGGIDASDSQAHPKIDSTLNPFAMQEENRGNLAGHKRPLPEGKESGGAYSGAQGGIAVDAAEAVREEAVCQDGADSREGSSVHPEVFCRRDSVSTLSSRGGRDTLQTQTRTRINDVDADDRCSVFAAPSFLTPQSVVGAIDNRVGVAPPVDGVASTMAPFRASSPADSTPSNGSSSPALVAASLTPRPSRKPGGGRAGVEGEGVGRKDAGGEDSGVFVGYGGGEEDGAALSEERHFSSSSQTQTSTSTREPSPSPTYSMQEGSSPDEWDRRGESDDGEVRDQDNKVEERVHQHEAVREEEKGGDSVTPLHGRSAPGVVNTVIRTVQGCLPSVADAVAGGLSPSVKPDPNPGVMVHLGRGPSKAPCAVRNTGISTGKDGFAHTAERATDCVHCPREDGEVDEAARSGMLREGEEYDEDINDSVETLADVVEVEGQASAPSLLPEAYRPPPVGHRDTRVDMDNMSRRHEGDRDTRGGETTAARGSDRAPNGDEEKHQRGAAALVTRPFSMGLSQRSAGADVAGGMETETDVNGGSVAFGEPNNGRGVLTQEE